MRSIAGSSFVILAALVAFFLTVPAALAQEAGGGEGTVASAPEAVFPRHADPVILKGEQLVDFLGARGETFRVLADRDGGGLKPIPYQVDERNQWGEFVVIKGKRVIPDTDEGAFDENDEIVFLTRDLGVEVAKDKWPAGYKAAHEIEVTDPLNGAKGYAYVLMYESAAAAPAPSDRDYISYEDRGAGIIHAMNYELGFVNPVSGLDYDLLTVTPEAGGSGEDLFDRLKVRYLHNFRRWVTLGLSPRLDKNEENFLVKVYGYKDGPVRVTRVMKVNLQLIWKLPAPGATVNSVLYPEWVEWPVPINLPFKPTWAFTNIELGVSHDFNFGADKGVKVYYSGSDAWWDVDGKMTEPELAVNKEEANGEYYGFDGTAAGLGAGFYTVRIPKTFPTLITGIYRDDTERGIEPEYYDGDEDNDSRPEWIKGATPLAGGRFLEWDDVPRGVHTVFFYHFYPPDYSPGKEKAFLDIIDHPVTVTVN